MNQEIKLPDRCGSLDPEALEGRLSKGDSRQVVRWKPAFKKSSPEQSCGLCPNLPESSIPPPKIDIDNRPYFRYLDGY